MPDPSVATPARSWRPLHWLLPCLLLALVACGGRQETPPVPVEPGQVEDGGRFALLGASGDPYEGRPSLLLRFNRPLAAGQPFDERIQVKDAQGAAQSGGWMLEGDDSTLLRFPYVAANLTFSVSVAAELEAADGSLLGQRLESSVHSGELPALLGFASQGSILPARGSDGLPLVAVNANEADVEFYRVKPSSYSDFFARWQRNGQRSWWQLEEMSRLAEPVYANRFALPDIRNERNIALLPVQTITELRPPGLYVAVMKRPGQFDGQLETTHYMVTDLGLHARSAGHRLWVHVASLDSGQPRGGVQVEVLDKHGKTLLEGSTDGAGQVSFDYRPKPEDVLIARAGGELTLLPFRQPALDLSDFVVDGRPYTDLDAYAWSGRDLYRPGEPLQVSILLRDADGRPLPHPPPLFARLRQPDGRQLAARTLEPGELGYYRFERPIAEDAATGRWSLELRLDPDKGEPVGRFDFRVEEFLPERLKLTLDSPQQPLAPGQPLPLRIEGAYLYGAPAAGNRIKAELLLRPDTRPVASLPDYRFGDPTVETPAEALPVLDEKLPDSGVGEHQLPLPEQLAASTAPVQLRLAASLFESGGRAVRRSLVRTIWPAEFLVGVRPLFDEDEGAPANAAVGFEVLRADAQGRLSAAANLEVTLLREERDYRWSWVDGEGWRSDYTRRFQSVDTQTLALDGQRPGQLSLRVEWGDYRLEIRDPQSGLTMRYPFTAGWSWNDANRGLDARPDKVKLALDKTGYRAGDTLEVTLTPPHPGPGVLLVESSDGVLHRQAFDASPGARLNLKVAPEWQRHDVYLTALVFRPASAAASGGPQRAVGIAHLPISRGDRDLDLRIEAAELVRPGETLDIRLHAPQLAGQRGHVVVEAVDQGILSLTGYALPDAAAHFLARRALGVESRDVYGRVIERLRGERARLRYGGDAALASLPQARRPTARVQTVALHHAPVAFDDEGRAQLGFAMPDFNGALRIAALAYGEDRYGKAQAETRVRAPLVLEVSTPRAMAGGDQSRVTVDLQNLSGETRRYRVEATAHALLAIDGEAQTVELADGARRTLGFALRALPGEGIGRFSVAASHDGGQIERQFELTVRPAWPAQRNARSRVQQGPGSVALGRGPINGLVADSARVQVSLSSAPPLPFARAVQGLIDYPHGCAEQTSSRLWPLLWLDEETATRFGLDPIEASRRQRMIENGFNRLAALQLSNGQFGFWPGDSWAQPQMTAFIAEMLLAAREAGHAIPTTMLDRALARLNEELLTGGDGYYSYDHAQHLRFAASAHAGYVLAKTGRAPLGSLRNLYAHERDKSLTALPLLQLGLALRLQGDQPRGDAAIAEAMQKEDARPRYLGDYGSRIRDEALMLALLHEHDLASAEHRARLIELARELRDPAVREHHLSTQEQLAVFRLGRQLLAADAPPLSGSVRIGQRRIDLPPVTMYSFELEPRGAEATLELSVDGEVWIAEDAIGAPTRAPAVREDVLRIRRHWYRMDGSLFAGDSLREGETLIARLQVSASENVPDALITDLLPAGLEVENLDLGDSETLQALLIDGTPLSDRRWGADIRHEEYRDDRYVAAIKLWADGQANLYYLVRAVSPGRYAVPMPYIEDMYRPRLYGIGKAEPATLQVLPP